MVRPKKDRMVAFNPDVSYFKPRGIPMTRLEEVQLTVDEREAIRLADLAGLSHEASGKQMGVSRATFGRIVQQARMTVADALINGKAIKVEGGNYTLSGEFRKFVCSDCHEQWDEAFGTGRPANCPVCKGLYFGRVDDNNQDGNNP
jgi:uncharacterized protein